MPKFKVDMEGYGLDGSITGWRTAVVEAPNKTHAVFKALDTYRTMDKAWVRDDPPTRWRIRRLWHTSASGCYGWRDTIEIVGSEEEGRAAVAAPMKAYNYCVQLDEDRDGRWVQIAERRRKGQA